MLQQALTALMNEKAFPDISVQDITERAELNRATFYKHFLDKYDLINSMIRERFQSMLNSGLSQPHELNTANLNSLIQIVYDCTKGFHGSCTAIHAHHENGLVMEHLQHQVYEVLLNWLQTAPQPAKRTDSSPEIVALLTSWMIFGPIMQVARGTSKLPKQALINQVMVSAHAALDDYLHEN